MQIPRSIKLLLNKFLPVITTVPNPSLNPVISAASTAIHAAIKFKRNKVKTPGSIEGIITDFQILNFEPPRLAAVKI